MPKHQRVFLFLVLLLLLAAIACQTTLSQPSSEPDTDAIVRDVVATIEAGRAVEIATPDGFVSTQLPPLSRDLEISFVNVYQRANPSVVHIFVYSNQFDVPLGSGSGFVIDSDGYIVTNNHVVAEGDTFEVSFVDGERGEASLIGADVDSDLAVLQVKTLPEGVNPIPLGDSANLDVGQFVIAIGNPFGEAGSMSFGIISALGRTIDSQRAVDGGGRYSLPQVIQTDAAINPGNSGGPLLNLDGEVIGVNSSIFTRSGTNSGVGFSIPVNAVKRITPVLIADGSYTYPYLGISMAGTLDLETQQELELPSTIGVYVTNVVPDTPAAEAGLIGSIGPGGDFIQSIDGNTVRDSSDLISYLVFETEVGQTIELSVLRGDEEIVVPLTLGARP